MIRLAASALLLLGTALPAAARDVSGEVHYLQRIALDPGAQLVVELRAPHGIVGEYRADTEGAQVPLPFSVTTSDEGPLILRAAILRAGVAQWVSDPVAVPAGSEAVELAPVLVQPFVPMGFVSRMRCGETMIDVGFLEDEARMRVGGKVWSLPLAVSASGARFSDGLEPETEFWSKGNAAYVTIAGEALPECEPVVLPSALPFVARGQEPGWVLDVSRDGMVLARQDGAEIRSPLPQPEDSAAGTLFASDEMRVTVTPGVCHDSMSGMAYPLSVSVAAGGDALQGCGGDPLELLQGHWVVEEMGGTMLSGEVTLDISGTHVSGKAACNRYVAELSLSGEGMSIAPGPLTMMACDEAAMALEQEFVGLLPGVTGFDFDPDTGALLLLANEGPILRAAVAR